MKRLALALLVGVFGLGFAVPMAEAKSKHPRRQVVMKHRAPSAAVVVHISIGAQNMTVDVDGGRYADWRVSTARRGYHTPRGHYRVQAMARMHYSRKYDNSPMPYSLFFKGGYAIHGTNYVRSLGVPASHGCVRLAPANAATLYALVQSHGAGRTQIIVSD